MNNLCAPPVVCSTVYAFSVLEHGHQSGYIRTHSNFLSTTLALSD